MNRKYRDRTCRENVTIVIPVILCPIARERGTQYTKRLLPDFLTPRSVIRLDYLREAAGLPKTERSEDAICDLIGCLDPRTARHQMRRLTTAIEMVSLDLARQLSATPELGELPEISPRTSPGDRLTILFATTNRAWERAGSMYSPPSLRQLLQATIRNQERKPPSNYASSDLHPP